MGSLVNQVSTKDKLILAALALVLLLLLLLLGVSTGNIQRQIGFLLLQSLGVVASMCLAAVTWFALRQNQQLIEQQKRATEQNQQLIDQQREEAKQKEEETKRQKQKPLYRDIIMLISSLIEVLSNNRDGLTEEFNDWSDNPEQLRTLFWEDRLTLRDDIDPIARIRLKEERPELYEKLGEHDQLIWKIGKQVQKTKQELRGPIGGYLDEIEPLDENVCLEKQLADHTQRSDEIGKIVDALLNFYHRWGREIETDLWLSHQSTFGKIAEDNAEEELDQLLILEQQYYDMSSEIIEDLFSLRNDLQLEYGISFTKVQSIPSDTL